MHNFYSILKNSTTNIIAYFKYYKESIIVLDYNKDLKAVKLYINQTEVAKLKYMLYRSLISLAN